MLLISLLPLLATALITTTATATAIPSPHSPSPPLVSRGSTCMPSSIASTIVTTFIELLNNASPDANATATTLLSSNFTDSSDSVNYLLGQSPGTPTFTSAAAFVAAQASQPPIDVTLIDEAFSCNGVITFRWLASVGTEELEVRGITVLYASLKGKKKVNVIGADGWQLDEAFGEFNSAAFIVDLGGDCPAPAS